MIDKKKNNINSRNWFNLSSERQKYPIGGFMFGMLFPILSWLIDIIYRNITVSISGIIDMHFTNPLHFVINLAPFILGGVALALAKIIDKDQEAYKQEIISRKKHLRSIYEFPEEISKGNFEVTLESDDDDELIQKLNLMRDNLKKSTDKEIEQNWQIKGRDIISTTLRKYNRINELSYQVLLDIINYTNLIQGSFYLFEEEKQSLKNIASYAYDRQKFIKQTIPVGKGLIGQAAYEKDYIYRKEIPEDYVSLTSGILGDKKPGSIIIVPIISDEKLRGVIEFAAVDDEIPKRVIDFVVGLSGVIGQTIFNILINEKTTNLLEESRAMTTELQENEEELRQNAEEMLSTQEELEETNKDLAEKITEVENSQTKLNSLLENASEVISIIDKEGIIQYESPATLKILGIEADARIGASVFEGLDGNGKKLEKLIDSVLEHSSKKETIEFLFSNQESNEKWLEITAINLLDNPAINGIILNTRDISQRKIAEIEQKKRGQMQSLSENSNDVIMRVGCDSKKFFYLNPTFTDYTGIDVSDAISKTISEVNLPEGLDVFFDKNIKEMIENPVNKEDEFILKLGDVEQIMQISSIPEFNDANEIETVLFVAHDITERKIIELDIKDKNQKINDSINYAKRIQNAILPDNGVLQESFKDSFIFYKPKDVVSGDFPWMFEKGDNIYVAAVDCTGHGVPGALLSFIGYFILQNIVDHERELTASQVCDELHYGVRKTLRQDKDGANARDGMDIALCKYNKKTNVLEYAGAHRPLYLLRNNELEIFKGDRKAIGGIPHKKKVEKDFTNYIINIEKDDKIFFFSDGLPDQIGGERKKKYQAKRMREIILKETGISMSGYSDRFIKDFEEYKGENKQIDDVLLIGIGF